MQITLQAREGATMAPGETVRIRCLAGTLWITNQHDSRDHVLDPGASIDLPGARRHYLSSVGRCEPVSFEVHATAARISVRRSGGPPRARAWRGRLSALLALPARAAAWLRLSGGAGA